ncbi:putative acetyltransferase domain protein, partial [Vibrio cholerae O1 str. EC-0009]
MVNNFSELLLSW